MKLYIIPLLLLLNMTITNAGAEMSQKNIAQYVKLDQGVFDEIKSKITTKTLPNGLETVLIKDDRVPKVFMAMAYRVGSANETSKSRGMAHLLEHMVFKGTEKLSEADIWSICSKYGASSNAYTSKDFTCYFFEVDKANWEPFLEMLSDCSQNLRCDKEHLASELKAVVQELKMNRDKVFRIEWNNIVKNILPANHPYYNPTIGYVQELADMKAQDIKEFYKQNYKMSNATLFVIGDFDQKQMSKAVEKNFGSLPNKGERDKVVFPAVIQTPISSQTTVYHEVGMPCVTFGWSVPGAKDTKSFLALEICVEILANDLGGRLKKALVDDLKIAESVSVTCYDFVNNSDFMIKFSCKEQNIDQCSSVVLQQLENIALNGVEQDELEKACAVINNKFLNIMTSQHELFCNLMCYIFATDNNPQSWFDLPAARSEMTKQDIQLIFKKWLNPFLSAKVTVLPINESIKEVAQKAQEQFRQEEEKILANHPRTTQREEPKYSLTLGDPNKLSFEFPKPTTELTLKNGLKIVALERPGVPQVSCVLASIESDWINGSLDGNVFFDLAGKMLIELSENCSKDDNIAIFNTLGASVGFSANGASLTVTTPNFDQAFKHFAHVICNPVLSQEHLEKLSQQGIAECNHLAKDQRAVSNRIKNNLLYKDSDFNWTFEQAMEKYKTVKLSQIENALTELLVPSKLILVLVGQLPENWQELVSKTIGTIEDKRTTKTDRKVPQMVKDLSGQTVVEKMVNDQKRLLLVRPNALTTKDTKERTKLNILNTIVLSGAGSELFALREATGLFYTANGGFSLSAFSTGSSDTIVTIINPQKVEAFKNMVWEMLEKLSREGITQDKLSGARQDFFNGIIAAVESNEILAKELFRLKSDDLGFDYFDQAQEVVNSLSIEELNELAKKYCTNKGWATIEVGGSV